MRLAIWLTCPLALAELVPLVGMAHGMESGSVPSAVAKPAGVYCAQGGAIVGRGGKRYHNRPLYCNRMPGIVLAGDLPHIRFVCEPYVGGCLMIAVERDGQARWVHDFSDVAARYRADRMAWDISDPSLPGLKMKLDAAPMADAPGFCARLTLNGARAGDRIIWAYGGATQKTSSPDGTIGGAVDPTTKPELTARGFVPDDCTGNAISISADMFLLSPPPYESSANAAGRVIAGRCTAAGSLVVANASVWQDPAALASGEKKTDKPLAVGVVELSPGRAELMWAVESFDGAGAGESPRLKDPANAFAAAMRRAEAVGKQLEVDTPDERFNAAVSAVCAAIDGILRPPRIYHGAMCWNMPYMGWRTMYGPTALGWHDEVKQAAALYINTQDKTDTKKEPHSDAALGHTAEAMDSRFYGLGRLQHGDQWRYDMQSVLFDMVIHAWRWTGDPELEKLLRDSLDLHLQWMKDCFDPDDDGVYESYQNAAEVDQVWYNGGGTAEETAYAFNGHMAAIDLARRSGDAKAGARHQARARKILKGFLGSLWIPDKGYVGAYREQLGLKRLHEDSWLYSIFLPIDARMLTDEQSAQALHYTEWGLERVKMPLGGERCWTSNWVPGTWSSRMLWPAHAYSLALAHWQAGMPDEGWELMKGGFLESCYNKIVPGGFDCDTTGTDFHDVSSMFARAAVEGLFGYVPDYPNGTVRCSPRFPSDWNRASIRTRDFSLSFKRSRAVDDYCLSLTNAARMRFSVPVRARRVVWVEVDGKPAQWKSSPGYGHTLVTVSLTKRTAARVTVKWSQVLRQSAPVNLTGTAGLPITLSAGHGKIVRVSDPQGALSEERIENGVVRATVTPNAGCHLVLALVDVGELSQWQQFKLRMDDPKAEAERAAKTVAVVPREADWSCVDIGGSFNADVTAIFKQEYLSPRPKTCSVRLGSNGYMSWPFYFWGAKAPEMDLSSSAKMLDPAGRLTTPQGVPFHWGAKDRNIAFTSQWDNFPREVTVPVGQSGTAVWFLVCGSTNQMQGRIANAEIRLAYSDGAVDRLELVPPFNFWSLCGLPDGSDYNYKRDAFALPKTPPATVQLGKNCRAVLLNRRLRQGVELNSVTLATLSQEVVIGLMGVTLQR